MTTTKVCNQWEENYISRRLNKSLKYEKLSSVQSGHWVNESYFKAGESSRTNILAIEAVALDCEMVGSGHDGSISILARVALVNEKGVLILDEYVKPTLPVTDLREHITGLTLHTLRSKGKKYHFVRKLVARHIKGKILVGHSIHMDLDALGLEHPSYLIRDTAKYQPLHPPNLFKNGRYYTPSLKSLYALHFGEIIQQGIHHPLEDACATLCLYLKCKTQWNRKYIVRAKSTEQQNSTTALRKKSIDQTNKIYFNEKNILGQSNKTSLVQKNCTEHTNFRCLVQNKSTDKSNRTYPAQDKIIEKSNRTCQVKHVFMEKVNKLSLSGNNSIEKSNKTYMVINNSIEKLHQGYLIQTIPLLSKTSDSVQKQSITNTPYRIQTSSETQFEGKSSQEIKKHEINDQSIDIIRCEVFLLCALVFGAILYLAFMLYPKICDFI